MARHLQHVRSSVVENDLPKLPTADKILFGELAVNYAKDHETISLKNTSGEVITFTNDNEIKRLINEKVADVKNGNTSIVDENKVAILPTATTSGYGVVIVDDTLDSGSTNPVQNNTVDSALTEISKVTSAALNDLETRKVNVSDFETLATEVSEKVSGVTISGNSIVTDNVADIPVATNLILGVVKVDDALDSGSTNPVQNNVVNSALTEIDKVTSAALNDLEERKVNVTDFETLATEVSGKVSGVTISGVSIVSNNVAAIPIATDDTLGVVIVDNDLDEISENPIQNKAVTSAISLVEEVTASALNDLNDRLNEHSADTVVHVTSAERTEWNNKQGSLLFYSEDGTASSVTINNGSTSIACDVSDGGTITVNSTHTQFNSEGNSLIVGTNGEGGVSVVTTNNYKLLYNGNEVAVKSDIVVDNELSSSSTYPVQNCVIDSALTEISKVSAAAFNDLENRKVNVTDFETLESVVSGKVEDVKIGDTSIVDANNVAILPSATTSTYGIVVMDATLDTASTNPIQNSAITKVIYENEEITAAALNDLNDKKLDDVTISGISIVSDKVADIPIATTSGYGVVKVDDTIDTTSTNPIQNATISTFLESKELVIAAALNDLHDAITSLQALITDLDTRVTALENAANNP